MALWAASHFLRAIGLHAGVPPLLRAPRVSDEPRGALRLDVDRHASAMQKGPLWWAGHHVNHHRYADRDGDPHSPMVSGFYYAHIGWFLNDAQARSPRGHATRSSATFSKAPEIALHRRATSPCRRSLLAVAMYLAGGMPWLVWGFCLPTMTLAHATFRDQHREPPVRVAPLRDHRRVAQQRVHRVLRRRRRVAQQPPPLSARRRATASTGGSSISTWYVIRADAAVVGLAWDVQAVPERIYAEARVAKPAGLCCRRSRASGKPCLWRSISTMRPEAV